MRPLLYTSPHLPNIRMDSNVCLFRNKFWASKYRGSAADFLALQAFCANPGIPPQKTQNDDYRHLLDFLRLSSMQKVVLVGGCSSRGLGSLLSKTADSEAIPGSRAVHTCCFSYCCMAGDLARADQAQLLSKIYCHKRDINLTQRKVCSVHHVLRKCTRGDSAVYLHRAGPGAMDHRRCLKGYHRASK